MRSVKEEIVPLVVVLSKIGVVGAAFDCWFFSLLKVANMAEMS